MTQLNEKYLLHWCPCHLQNVVVGDQTCNLKNKDTTTTKSQEELRNDLKDWMCNWWWK